MRRHSILRALALTLAVATTATGCASTAGPPRECVSRSADVQRVEPTSSSTRPSVDLGSPEEPRGLDPTHWHHDGLRPALFFFGGLMVMGAVVVDLLILPYTACHHECFHCTTTVVHVCYD